MRFVITASALAAAVVGVSVGAVSHEASTLERIRRTGIVRVAYTNEPPHAWRGEDGRVTGEGPEVARHVLHAIGVDSIEWVWSPLRSIFLELRSGRVDLVAAGTYVTPERARDVRFTRPTLEVPTALLVRTADTTWLHSLEDLVARDTGRLAIMSGSAERGLATRAGLDAANELSVPDPMAGRAAVLAGRVDAFTASVILLRRLRAVDSDSLRLTVIAVAPPGTALESSGIGRSALAARLDDEDLVRMLDQPLSRWLGSPDHLRVLSQLGLDGDLVPVAARR
jgi:polar amino acid transport system substrate-binding protein